MKVYIILEDWQIDSGESGIFTSVFSTLDNAKIYFKKLKNQYAEDYETNTRKNNKIYESDGFIEVTFEDNADYYKLLIEEKEIDIEMEEL